MSLRSFVAMTAAAAALGLAPGGQAVADTRSAPVDVSGRFAESCSATTQPIEFGEMLRASSQQTGIVQRSLVVTCSERLVYRVGLDAGLNHDPATPQYRRMAGPNGAYASYTVLRPNAGGDPSAIWGDAGLGGTLPAGSPFVGTGNGVSSSYPYTAVTFGVVPGNGDASGSYTDTLTMTVSY